MELWGGIECTINRVRDNWSHQLKLSGHATRIGDLELIAELGIETLRYPILWEALAPDSDDIVDWEWADRRLERLRDLAIAPIIGLIHHGSGPHYTGLAEDSFAPGLARFAGRVAERFPWLEYYTPVNEPLTTARFSGLYGHWYPHGRSDRCFARALINQCRATVLSMQSIRRCNSDAKLVQTEDLGTTYSTPHMRYQCEFDNERRWLTWDLLCGRVNREHPLYLFLIGCGVSPGELDWFTEHPCPPALIGVNHYVTSDRFLDERAHQYNAASVGQNHHERYADVEAVRALSGDYRGFRVLRDAWERYKVPVALTEVHLGCSREQQMRWLREAWNAAQAASQAGCDIRAVTAWALFGTFNWDTLLTREGAYEPGAFDVRGRSPRRTAVARLISELREGGDSRHPAAHGLGWWQRPEKVLYGGATRNLGRPAREPGATEAAPILICGGAGSLGRAIARACGERGLPYRSFDRAQLDVCDADAVGRLVAEIEPWAVINAAGFIGVDDAEHQRSRCFRLNTAGAAVLMEAARRRDIPFMTFSSDLVFDGARETPYVEGDATAPLNVYGRSKEAAETAVLPYQRTLCVRTAAFFGCWERGDFVSQALQSLSEGRRFCAASDVVVSPTYLPDLAGACLDLLIDDERGIFHLANQGSVSWAEFAELAAASLNVDCHALQRMRGEDMRWAAPRPGFSALRSTRATLMPTLESALRRYAGIAPKFLASEAAGQKSGTSGR